MVSFFFFFALPQKLFFFSLKSETETLQVAGTIFTRMSPDEIQPSTKTLCSMADDHFDRHPMVFVFHGSRNASVEEIRTRVMELTLKFGLRSTTEAYKKYVSTLIKNSEVTKRTKAASKKTVTRALAIEAAKKSKHSRSHPVTSTRKRAKK